MTQTIDFLVDWLEFTYLCPENLHGLSVWDNFIDEFPEFEKVLPEMVLLSKGKLGYTEVYMYNDEFSIMYNPDHQDFGVHVTFPAHGLFRLCELFGFNSDFKDIVEIKSLLSELKKRGCRFSRMDICYDDYDKTFTPLDFGHWAMNGQLSTRSIHWSYFSDRNDGVGSTFYLGKRGSDRFLRVYDKDYESQGQIPAIRYEFELRKKYLDMIIMKVINGSDFSIADIISSMFKVVNDYDRSGNPKIDDRRKMRAGTLPEWENFLEQLFAKRMFNE